MEPSNNSFVEDEVLEPAKKPLDFVLSSRSEDGTTTPILYITADGHIDIDPSVPSRPMAQMILRNFERYLQTKFDDTGGHACRTVLRRSEEQYELTTQQLSKIEYFTYFIGGLAIILTFAVFTLLAAKFSRGRDKTDFDGSDFRDIDFK